MDTSSTTPPEKFVDTSGGTNVDFPDRTFAVWGDSASGDAVRGTAESGTGVHGSSSSGSGVLGATTSLYGVEGSADGTGAGVYGHTDGPGSGTIGHSEGGYGVQGSSGSSYGIYGTTSVGSAGMYGFAVDGYGVLGESISNAGVLGSSREWYGVEGVTNGRGAGVYGHTDGAGTGTIGSSVDGTGVHAESVNGTALVGKGSIQVQGNAVGRAELPAGQSSVTVPAAAATPASIIVLTPQSDPQGQLWVTATTGAFTIQASAAPTSDVPIAYLIIN